MKIIVIVGEFDRNWIREGEALTVYKDEEGYLTVNEVKDGKPNTIAVFAPEAWRYYYLEK